MSHTILLLLLLFVIYIYNILHIVQLSCSNMIEIKCKVNNIVNK